MKKKTLFRQEWTFIQFNALAFLGTDLIICPNAFIKVPIRVGP